MTIGEGVALGLGGLVLIGGLGYLAKTMADEGAQTQRLLLEQQLAQARSASQQMAQPKPSSSGSGGGNVLKDALGFLSSPAVLSLASDILKR